MTSRIYYTDQACGEFDATVVESRIHEGRPAVVLDRTAFYPTSGGQPFDTGQLGPARVVDVIDHEGEVLHIVDTPLPAGATVHGTVDWERRFDHMQQHTGQHVLSAAFEDAGAGRTVGFHLGHDASTIDLDRQVLWAEIEGAVDTANRIVWDDRPVSVRFVTDGEASTLPLRKPPTREGTLRLIDVSGFDLSACGGTHVARTGAIGMIAVMAAEKFKGGSRITFACGGRARRLLLAYRDTIAGSVRALSVLPVELPVAIEKLQQEAKGLRKANMRLQERLAVHEADRLFAAASERGGVRTIVETLDGFDAPALKTVAAALAARGGTVAALVSTTVPPQVVIARSPDVSVDANAVLRELLHGFGGKGGGKPDLAQGGGMNGDPAAIAGAIRTLIA